MGKRQRARSLGSQAEARWSSIRAAPVWCYADRVRARSGLPGPRRAAQASHATEDTATCSRACRANGCCLPRS